MSTERKPLYRDGDTIYTGDGVEVGWMDATSELLWRFDDAPGDRWTEPAGPYVPEPKRVHDLDSLHTAVRDWKDEATAPCSGYRPYPEHEGEVCTEITTEVMERDGLESVAVYFARRIKSGDDVYMLSTATMLLSVAKPGTIAAALAWGEPKQGYTASVGRAEVKDNSRAVAYVLDGVHAFVRSASSAPDTRSKHAWKVACAAADMMVIGLVHGGGTPSWVSTFTGVTWHPEHWLVMLAVLKYAVNNQTGRSRGIMPSVQIQDTPNVPDFVDPQTSTFQVLQALSVRGYPKLRYVISPDKSRGGKAQGLWSLNITAPHASGKANIYPTLAVAKGGVSVIDVYRMCASAADFMSAAQGLGGSAVDYSITFDVDPSDNAWWKRHFDGAQADARAEDKEGEQ